jgi:hypothetical protein
MLKQKIYSMMFLVLFSTFFTHSIYPHEHHTHETISEEVQHSHEHDGHTHKHSDNTSHPRPNESESFLDFILGHHTHSSYNSDITTEIVRVSKKNLDSKRIVSLTSNPIPEGLFISFKKTVPLPEHLGLEPQNPFLLNCPLRGPPTLG